ncbi:sporulation-specific N-acetylmuramoyl-L-alanine amidase [Kroppenstedtia guangzhouensis]|uniref:Sporulation-specific N-acetylmuramoyl-L-alanine amidase n=1 Tax=Kroppenstedtia guangzhouensis TaxID=1274356 RepID=A0ABQ1G0J6_9BACL|nr:N-acetylmuramoyl-L-alanine amidase [Kroppenstedtia guangzhouensis]GGA33700.1 sporulation-specific N-acetylmuramoyl-L-alanine amidase [Kroppenstedtia guangzhouensis]
MAKKVVIDPGHGGSDSGAVNGSYREKDFTLDIALKVRNYLVNNYDVNILMTRTTDTTVSLTQRTNYANANNADYFASIHINAGGGTGWESYIYNGTVSQFTIHAQNTIHSTVMGVIGPKYGVRDRGKKRANFHVLRESNMPAILVENLFIDTTQDLNLLRNATFIQDLANAIGLGIAQALSLPKKATGLYKVITGSFQSLENAQSRKSFLEKNGIEATIVSTTVNGQTYYRVQAGAFSQRANAEARLDEVKALGITDAFILYE